MPWCPVRLRLLRWPGGYAGCLSKTDGARWPNGTRSHPRVWRCVTSVSPWDGAVAAVAARVDVSARGDHVGFLLWRSAAPKLLGRIWVRAQPSLREPAIVAVPRRCVPHGSPPLVEEVLGEHPAVRHVPHKLDNVSLLLQLPLRLDVYPYVGGDNLLGDVFDLSREPLLLLCDGKRRLLTKFLQEFEL